MIEWIRSLGLPPWTGPTLGPRTTTALLFAGVFAVLIAATLFGHYLKRRVHGRRVMVVESYRARVRGWWILVIGIGLGFLGGRQGVVLLFAFASFGALREFITLSPTRRGDHWSLVASFFLVLPLHYLAIWKGWMAFAGLFIPVYAFLFLPIISALSDDHKRFMDRAANLQWALMICVYCISHVPALLSLRIAVYGGRQLLLIAFLVLVVQSGDVAEKFFSDRFGRHRIAPEISAGKTWEGFALACAAVATLGALLAWITPFSIIASAGVAVIATAMGLLGSLVMSAIKRDRGVRFWGHAIVGHGGLLDRAAPVAFAAPIYYHLVRTVWAL
ncbi:phosphatidate cytidylyltransferase [Niveibacterium sp. SC-1]|uniref:phosphatidate cytidylyltransferase n=1 Tax=Niveibacterium sp. SC-1 TaxID=3135646 RepID=UPI00311F7B1E